MAFNGAGCITCEARHKKCDQTRPGCRRCHQAGIECGGYPAWRNPGHSVSGSGRRPARTASSFHQFTDTPGISILPADDTGWYRQIAGPSQQPSPVSPLVPGGLVPAGLVASEWHEPFYVDSSFEIGLPSTRPSLLARPIETLQTATPPYDAVDMATYYPERNEGMTGAQASLFDAVFSLGQPPDSNAGGSLSVDQARPSQPEHTHQTEWMMSDDDDDPEDVLGAITQTLPLDRQVKSNSVPFILQSYALWMRRFLFEPLRVVQIARDYVSFRYHVSSESRWKMMLISEVTRTVTATTAYDLDSPPNLAVLVARVSHNFALASSREEATPEADKDYAQRSLDNSFEVINMLVKISTLSNVMKLMQAAAPLFRRACPDPQEDLVHLPGLLATIDTNLQYYAMLDILLGVITHRPMFFRYNTSFTDVVPESLFSLEDGPGLRWVFGIPDRLVITLARMNTLLEDVGSFVPAEDIKELEAEIYNLRAVVTVSPDPSLTVARLVVQECWRQAALIYLYMGLCGGDSRDARVVRARETFMKLVQGVKPSRFPDSFLVFPMLVAGVATSVPGDQDIMRHRLRALPECSRPHTFGNQLVQILDVIWTRTNATSQPVVWSDLRLACLWVTGL